MRNFEIVKDQNGFTENQIKAANEALVEKGTTEEAFYSFTTHNWKAFRKVDGFYVSYTQYGYPTPEEALEALKSQS